MKPDSFLQDQSLFPKKSRDPGPGSYELEKSSESHRPKVHGGVKWYKPSRDMSAKFKQPDQKHDFSEPPKERIRKQFAPQLAGIHTKLGEIRVQNPTPGPGAYNAPENINKG